MKKTMRIETKSMHVTPAGGNVFLDLGFEPEEAARLKADSDRIISEQLAIKERKHLTNSLQDYKSGIHKIRALEK